MKKLILSAIIIASCLTSKSQQTIPINDTAVISSKDIVEKLNEYSEKVSHKDWLLIQQAYIDLYQTSALKKKQIAKPKK